MNKMNAISISDFCKSIGISVATFYRNISDMPRTIRVGRQRRILIQDKEQWIHHKQQSQIDTL